MINCIGSTWSPFLSGNQAIAAWRSVRHISEELARIENWENNGASLARGASGAALLFGYLAKATGETAAIATCRRLQDTAGANLISQPTDTSLYGGFPGIAWTVSHLRDLLDPDSEDPATEMDKAMLQLLGRPRWSGPYDLITGLVGHGVFALERLHTGQGRAMLTDVVNHLDRLALPKADGLAWFTPAKELPDHQREFAPTGCWNLGLAHGIPGVLALLSCAVRAKVEPEKAKHLLEGGVTWLLARRRSAGNDGWFATLLPEGRDDVQEAVRLGWCYGDLGLASALLMAGHTADKPHWVTAALELVQDAARRPLEACGIRDSCLCHGTAGVALLFMRLFQATGEPFCRSAAQVYLERTLAFQQPGRPFGGFPNYSIKDEKTAFMRYIPGLLEGNTGVALVLLAAITDVAPNWDRHLLISQRPDPLSPTGSN